MALREQNAHIQRKVASGDGGDDLLDASEAQQKLHSKVTFNTCLWSFVLVLSPLAKPVSCSVPGSGVCPKPTEKPLGGDFIIPMMPLLFVLRGSALFHH